MSTKAPADKAPAAKKCAKTPLNVAWAAGYRFLRSGRCDGDVWCNGDYLTEVISNKSGTSGALSLSGREYR